MKKTLVYFIIVSSIVLSAFKQKEKLPKYLKKNPPGTIKIADNFYCDKYEVSNLGYREYCYWMNLVYGKDSLEIKSFWPDTTVWNSCSWEYSSLYFRHPALNNNPVVGISQQQALDFSKWRSDRVFETILIRNKFITPNTNPTPENHFTIERYFGDSLSNYLTTEKAKYYPQYRLPTSEERTIILKYNDQFLLKKNKKNWTKESLMRCNQFNFCLNNKSFNEIFNDGATYPGVYLCPNEKSMLCHIRGNVREWLSEPKQVAGGSWNDPINVILEKDIDTIKVNNSNFNYSDNSTGFRNILEWKVWERK